MQAFADISQSLIKSMKGRKLNHDPPPTARLFRLYLDTTCCISPYTNFLLVSSQAEKLINQIPINTALIGSVWFHQFHLLKSIKRSIFTADSLSLFEQTISIWHWNFLWSGFVGERTQSLGNKANIARNITFIWWFLFYFIFIRIIYVHLIAQRPIIRDNSR